MTEKFDKDTHKICSVKNCNTIFEKYITDIGSPGVKCKFHYDELNEYVRKREEEVKLANNFGDKLFCSRCGEYFKTYKTKTNRWSKTCIRCSSLYFLNKQKYFSENTEKVKEIKEKTKENKPWQKSRMKKIEEIGIEEYRKHQANRLREWRAKK